MAKLGTHITNIVGKVRVSSTDPTNPVIGDEFFNRVLCGWYFWSGNSWIGVNFSSTSTSTTTSTSTSTSTSSTTTSTSSSTSTSTSTSTTTTG